MPILNKKVVERYLNELKRLNEFDGVVGDIDMGLIMQLPDVFEKESADPQFDQLEDIVLRAFEEATNDFVAMRRREGRVVGDRYKRANEENCRHSRQNLRGSSCR